MKTEKTQELLTAIELFAGIGGFRLGLESANIQTILSRIKGCTG